MAEKKEKVSTIQKVRKDIDPQLCRLYNPAKHKWDRPWIAEPKFDGLRCLVVVNKDGHATAYSRNGKPLWNMESILGEIEDDVYEGEVHYTVSTFSGLVLDGEVYTQDWNLSMGIVKRSTQTHPDQDKLRYHVWDCLILKEWKDGKSTVSDDDRKHRLRFLETSKYVKIVPGTIVNNQEELENAYQKLLADGYEGTILKNPKGIYECGRKSPNWLKVKPWSDADLTVVRSYPGEGKHIGRIGGLVLKGVAEWNGRAYEVQTEVGTGFTDEERSFFQGLEESGTLAGKIVEIKFQDITVEGACRFPVYSRLRIDKE